MLDGFLAEGHDGRWASFENALIVPRQNGKGAILEARELAGLFLFGEQLILHSAHESKTAFEAFLRIVSLIESTPELSGKVAHIRRAHGEQGVELKTGQRLRFIARSTGSGRGFSGDTVILDEAYNLSAEALAALLPTMSARPNPQLWYTSSAPLNRPESDVLRKVCKRGRAGEGQLAYLEFCAEPEADRDDHAAWADANPAFGIRVFEDFITHERAALGDEDFARERLGIWFEEETGSSVIPPEAWKACRDERSKQTGTPSFAVDVAPDRSSAAFAVAGASTRGGVHVEVVDHRPGTAWVVDRATELLEQWKGTLAIAQGSPAWSLEPELRKAKIRLRPVAVAAQVQACGSFYDAVIEKGLRHIGQPELNRALAGAEKRPSGDAWLWSRKSSLVDISPLVAVTLALRAHATKKRGGGRFVAF